MNVNKNESLWIEKYRPVTTDDLVLPDHIKQKFKQYAKKEDIPNLGLFSNSPGCVLPGTYIEVKSEPNWLNYKDIIKKYDLSKKEYTFLKKYSKTKKSNKSVLIDDNSISVQLLKIAKSSFKYKQCFKFDKNYNNKFLKFEYWLSKLSIDDAFKKVKKLRKPAYVKYFETDKYTNEFSDFKSHNDVLKRRMSILYDNAVIPENCKKIDFWMWRGFTEQESTEKVKKIQNILKRI